MHNTKNCMDSCKWCHFLPLTCRFMQMVSRVPIDLVPQAYSTHWIQSMSSCISFIYPDQNTEAIISIIHTNIWKKETAAYKPKYSCYDKIRFIGKFLCQYHFKLLISWIAIQTDLQIYHGMKSGKQCMIIKDCLFSLIFGKYIDARYFTFPV